MVGVAFLAVADTGYSWLAAYDLYASGSLVDYGWSTGHLMLAAGASIVYDLAHPLPHPRGSRAAAKSAA